MINIIASGSKGNAVIYNKTVLVDCGVPYSLIEPFLDDLNIVLLTHEHGDHFNFATIRKMSFEKPSLRFGCGEHMLSKLNYIRHIDCFQPLTEYSYNDFVISPVILYHDVPNFGYRIKFNDCSIFHATDTEHLNGISAKDYDYYCLESNYNEETINAEIEQEERLTGFSYRRGVINSHLSEQQAQAFYFNNRKETSKLIRLHEHKNN